MTPEIEERLRFCPGLPTLSGVALRIVEMARDPDVDLANLSALLAKDPALASKILRVANSPLYGQRRRPTNLRQALMVLGLNATVTLALSFSLASCLKEVTERRVDLALFWRRSLLAALAARLLGEARGMHSLEELFLAGLLQDIGMLALDAAMPREYGPVVEGAANHESLVALERGELGFDHSEAGSWLLRQWGLPDYLPMATLGSHDVARASAPEDIARFVACVGVSGRIADVYIDQDTESAAARAAAAAASWLGLDRETLSDIFTQVSDALPEVEALFEMTVLSPSQAIAVTDQAREILTVRNLQLLQSATEERRLAQEYARLNQTLQETANRDALTGIPNRGRFDQVIREEFDRATEHGWPITLGFLDLDHFKSVNDRYGHQVGDKVLAEVAQTLARTVRSTDLVARYGGEEFVILMPGTAFDVGARVIERIRRTVAALELRTGDALPPVRVTVSAGVAAHMDDDRSFEKAEDLVRMADRALYLAKRNGRNRVELAD